MMWSRLWSSGWIKCEKTYARMQYTDWERLRDEIRVWCGENASGSWSFDGLRYHRLEDFFTSSDFYLVVYFEHKLDAAKFHLVF